MFLASLKSTNFYTQFADSEFGGSMDELVCETSLNQTVTISIWDILLLHIFGVCVKVKECNLIDLLEFFVHLN